MTVLDLEMRRRLYAMAQKYPGLHVRELARQLDTSMALVEYHLAILRQNGLATVEHGDGYARVFAKERGKEARSAAERKTLGLLRGRLPLAIVLYLLDRDEPAPHKGICEALGIGKSKLSFHLRKLEDAGVIRKTEDGRFEPVQRTRLMALLLENQPTPDVKQEFAKLWLALYGD
jgi:predicted transcriptional regulator